MMVGDDAITSRKREFDDILHLLSGSDTLRNDVKYRSFCRFAGRTVYSAPTDPSETLHVSKTGAGKLVGFAIIGGGRNTAVTKVTGVKGAIAVPPLDEGLVPVVVGAEAHARHQ